jgi:hypothetical protein
VRCSARGKQGDARALTVRQPVTSIVVARQMCIPFSPGPRAIHIPTKSAPCVLFGLPAMRMRRCWVRSRTGDRSIDSAGAALALFQLEHVGSNFWHRRAQGRWPSG